MIRIKVFKTVAAYPERPRFGVQSLGEPHQLPTFDTISEMAAAMRRAAPKSLPRQEPRYLENDTPGMIVWDPDSKRVVEYQRLSGDEVRELARLLKG